MKFEYTKETSLEEGQELYGIIAVSSYTYDGVYPITVSHIDYNNEKIIFEVDQPCVYVCCYFHEIEDYVFETETEAKKAAETLDFGLGLYVY